MWRLACIATSYPPGFNFWPGSRFSWYVRGSMNFLQTIAPIVLAWLLVLLILKRKLGRWWLLLAIVAAYIAYSSFSFSRRDGDMPAYIGARWGQRTAPWVASAGLALLGVVAWSQWQKGSRRGFSVILRDDAPRQ